MKIKNSTTAQISIEAQALEAWLEEDGLDNSVIYLGYTGDQADAVTASFNNGIRQ